MLAQKEVLTVLDKFMSKTRRVNKPYQAIKRTDEFKAFYSMFKEGITEQAKWASTNVSKLFESAGIEDNLQPLDTLQQQTLRGLIVRDMPTLSNFVTEFKTFMGLKSFFEWAIKHQYKNWGYMVKADKVEFDLTNPQYVAQLKDRAAYLLNQSSLDSTTIDDIIDTIIEGREDALTIDEVGQLISDNFDSLSDYRADMIARTEAANAMGSANYASMTENGVREKFWVVAGKGCDDCEPNEEDGEIPIDQEFSSGDMYEPAHPNCECYTQAVEIDLDTIDIWGGQ